MVMLTKRESGNKAVPFEIQAISLLEWRADGTYHQEATVRFTTAHLPE